MKSWLCVLLVVAVLPEDVRTQRPSDGPTIAMPIAVTTLPGTKSRSGAVLSARAVHHKKAGVGGRNVIAGAWHANTPDYSFTRLFDAGGGSTYDIQLGSMSTGLDYIATDSSERYAGVSSGWNVLAFTVGATTVGTSGSVVATEAAAIDGAAADVFSYGVRGSSLPSRFVDSVHRVLDSTEIDCFFPGDATAPARKGQLATIDFGLTYYSLDLAIRTRLQGVAPVSDAYFYFSVAKPSVDNGRVPTSWWGTTSPSAATIFVKKWNATSATWSAPAVFLTYSALGLAVSDAIDGLAVNPEGTKLLFSPVKTATSPAVSQLRYVRIAGASVVVHDYEYAGLNPVKVADQTGVEPDGDIKEICIVDPRIYSWISQAPGPVIGASVFTGLSSPPTEGIFPISVAGAMYRSYDATSAPTLDAWMTGWAPNGPTGVAALLLEIPPMNSFQFVPIAVTRNAVPAFPGDPVHVELRLPAPYDSNIQGTTVRAFWAAVNGSGSGSIGTSYMMAMTL